MLIIPGPLVASASGALGGVVASRNKSGPYLRIRAVPINPSTPFQNLIRSAMSNLAARWVSNLTQVERDAWEVYAANVPLPSPLGGTHNVSGINMFIKTNVPRFQAGLGRLDAAPVIFDVGAFTPVTGPIALASGDFVSFDFDNTDDWANATGAGLLLYTSKPKNASIQYHTGPYRFAGIILGDDTVPPTSPLAIAAAEPFSIGNRVFWYVRAMQVDGRYSALQRLTAVAT